MHLEQAKTIHDWQSASNLLLDVMEYLNRQSLTLWTKNQLTLDGLKNQYKDGELYLARNKEILEGVVFLQEKDPYFWPEITNRGSLFLHKLAVHPKYKGINKGNELIRLTEQEAAKRGLTWLRLDCDDREPLHKFYQQNNFKLIDIKRINQFTVARYSKEIKSCPSCS